jgi:hypothetical protein
MKVSTIFAWLIVLNVIAGAIGICICCVAQPFYNAFKKYHTEKLDELIKWISYDFGDICIPVAGTCAFSSALLWLITFIGGH